MDELSKRMMMGDAADAIESLTAQLAAERARGEMLAEALREIARDDITGGNWRRERARQTLAEWEVGNASADELEAKP